MSTGALSLLRQRRFAAIVALCCLGSLPATAVILYRTGHPAANTSAPAGELADSGWQYVGHFGGLQGTAIAPRFFITAKHVSGAGNSFLFRGVSYPLEKAFHDPASDLTIWKIIGNLPEYAPLYPVGDEIGKRLVVIGRGRERGAEVYRNGTLRGWDWVTTDTHIQRWGENIVSGALLYQNPANPLLYAAFDANGLTDEAHLAAGDSGGAVFIRHGDTWKLAGVNFSVDGVYKQPGGADSYAAALYDVRGYYERVNGAYVEITGDNPVPTSFYATRVSAKLAWIYSVTDPAGDGDGDGLPNLHEYAFHRNPLVADSADATMFAREEGAVTLTFTRVTTASDIQYQVQQSANLIDWQPASSQGETIATVGNVQTVKVTQPIGASPLFLRVSVTRP